MKWGGLGGDGKEGGHKLWNYWVLWDLLGLPYLLIRLFAYLLPCPAKETPFRAPCCLPDLEFRALTCAQVGGCEHMR